MLIVSNSFLLLLVRHLLLEAMHLFLVILCGQFTFTIFGLKQLKNVGSHFSAVRTSESHLIYLVNTEASKPRHPTIPGKTIGFGNQLLA